MKSCEEGKGREVVVREEKKTGGERSGQEGGMKTWREQGKGKEDGWGG